MGPADGPRPPGGTAADGPAATPDGIRPAPWAADYAALATVLGVELRKSGIPAGPDRCERLGRALTVMRPSALPELHACALATMVADPSQIEAFERVFAELFYSAATPRQPTVMAPQPGMEIDSGSAAPADESRAGPRSPDAPSSQRPAEVPAAPGAGDSGDPPDSSEVPAVRRVASASERLRRRDFSSLSPDELSALATLMSGLVIAVPPRRTRRYRPRKDGVRLDMRRTLRLARRTGGEPVRIARRAVRSRPRRLVVLCDISGSMEPYARALLQFMYASSRAAGRTHRRAGRHPPAHGGVHVRDPADPADPGPRRRHPGDHAGQGERGGTRLGGRHADRGGRAGLHGPVRRPWHGPRLGHPDHLRRLGDR